MATWMKNKNVNKAVTHGNLLLTLAKSDLELDNVHRS